MYVHNSPSGEPDGLGLTIQNSSACREYCWKRYQHSTGELEACVVGCKEGWKVCTGPWDLYKHCRDRCRHYRAYKDVPTDNSRACEDGCRSGCPNLGESGDDNCISDYDVTGDGSTGSNPVDNSGVTINRDHISKVACPQLCWGATITFWTCGTGGNVKDLQSLISGCPKIKSATACRCTLWTGAGRYVWWYWCKGGWVTVNNPGYRDADTY